LLLPLLFLLPLLSPPSLYLETVSS
jgi:hypothetical protein